ncbi:hypothetical protein CCP3SC1_230027 [Gammaproteobacteria bacterium]
MLTVYSLPNEWERVVLLLVMISMVTDDIFPLRLQNAWRECERHTYFLLYALIFTAWDFASYR